MTPQETEDLFIKSLDATLTQREESELKQSMLGNIGLATELSRYEQIRDTITRKQAATFGPYFAQKVITRIQQMRVEIDRQIAFFFKKYQLAALGVLIALLALNAVFSDKLSVSSLLGIDDNTVEETITYDFYKTINDDL